MADAERGMKIPSLKSIFEGNHKDVMLLAYYTALLKLFDGANAEADPTKCSVAEEVVDWIGYGVVVIVYIVRHFYLERNDPIIKKRPLWVKIVRCILFSILILCIHSQPISCSLPNSKALHTLSFIQGALAMTLAVIASEVCRKELFPSQPGADNHDGEGDEDMEGGVGEHRL